MATEKKSESDWEDVELLGPYRIHEQVPQSEHGRGELYRATHETSGASALVLKPAKEDAGSVPLGDWRVRCISSASPSYLALEVEHSPWSIAPDRQHSAEELVCLFEDVRAAVKRMAHHVLVFNEPRSRWRLGLGLVGGAAVVCTLVFALLRLAPVSQPPDGPDPLARAAPAPVERPDTFSNGALYNTTPQGQLVLTRPLPREPFKGQMRPPCKRHTQVELIGACWMPHKLKAPCPEDLYEYQGECYVPAFSANPPPQALGQ